LSSVDRGEIIKKHLKANISISEKNARVVFVYAIKRNTKKKVKLLADGKVGLAELTEERSKNGQSANG
jgi:hypothetical protein